jgi:hypothetical protein
MSVKINIIKPIKKNKTVYNDLLNGAFFFYAYDALTKESLKLKTDEGYALVGTGETCYHARLLNQEIILADVVIDVQVKE